MVNENPAREEPPRQQSSERAQPGTTTLQQGAGTGSQRGAPQVGSGNYSPGGSPGSQTEAYPGAGPRSQGDGSTGQAAAERGTSTWQGARSGRSGGGLQRQGFSPLSPYAENYEPGYGGGPFSIMRRISDEMDRFFENFGMGRSVFPGADAGSFGQRGPGAQNLPSVWSPHIEVCERNGKLLIQADLPGIKRDDIQVRIESDAVILQGERNQEQATSQGGYYRSERSYGSFYRSIPLPEGTNTESASASFRDGVLEIEFDTPRQPQRGRTLEIRDKAAADAPGRSGGSDRSTDATRGSQGS